MADEPETNSDIVNIALPSVYRRDTAYGLFLAGPIDAYAKPTYARSDSFKQLVEVQI
jgi:hypothetical protein